MSRGCELDTNGDGDCPKHNRRTGFPYGCPMPAPETCQYCDGTDPNCGFCDMGTPLDTQEDWDNSWGQTFRALRDGI